MPSVNPNILRWARETAGFSLEDAAKVLQLGGVRQSGEDTLRQYEEGAVEPSRPLILKMVKAYRRPLLAFYLPEPPPRGERGEDFRTLPEDRTSESAGPLDALVRDVYVRQRLVRTTLEEAEEAQRLPFVGSIRIDQQINEVGELVKKQLQFDINTFRSKRTIEDAFKYLRNQVERTGVFVLLIGNLGSHHSNVSVEVFRGFALADEVAPFIIINDQDAKAAWCFTLLHELIHIWLGQTGISGGGVEKRVERFCNDIASELLLPAMELEQWYPQTVDLNELVKEIGAFADARKISRTMVAYRLFQTGRVPREIWQLLTEHFRAMWLREKAIAKEPKNEGGGGPTYYVVRRYHLGSALIDLVKRSLSEGILTPTKAGRVLGVRPNNVFLLVDGV
jgi:Zn-dependent peptidase ImmA (M78 family)/transcriptional regulator with XRE-family HTH domain